MSVIIRDFELEPASSSPSPRSGAGKDENEKPGAKPEAKSPEMARAIEKHIQQMALRCLRTRAY
jgi:hypothetical protein